MDHTYRHGLACSLNDSPVYTYYITLHADKCQGLENSRTSILIDRQRQQASKGGKGGKITSNVSPAMQSLLEFASKSQRMNKSPLFCKETATDFRRTISIVPRATNRG